MFHTRRRKFHHSRRELFLSSGKRYPLPCENYVNKIKFNSKANEEAEKSYKGKNQSVSTISDPERITLEPGVEDARVPWL